MNKIELQITKSAYGGCGLGFANGKAIFVPFSAPDDVLQVIITKEKKNFSFGVIDNILSASTQRITPECPNFGICGGCDYLHLNYNSELNIKKNILAEHLKKISKLCPEDIPAIDIISGPRFHYRSHAGIKQKNSKNGFYAKESKILVPFPENGCLLLNQALSDGLRNLAGVEDTELRIALDSSGQFKSSMDKINSLQELENGLIYDRSIFNFFQSNRFLRSRMLELVESYASLSAADRFIDLGCGVGFFSIYLARKGNYGFGIDIDRDSINWAIHNSSVNSINSLKFSSGSFSNLINSNEKIYAAILDPPRAGLPKNARIKLISLKPSVIVYISCDPSTFARDVRDFIDNGYAFSRLSMIDMFPGTYHIEVIGLFKKRTSAYCEVYQSRGGSR
jgi:23S rRNA (uracil1939-C5)-methyltransferase